jgi:hypothetical protein
MSAVPLAMMVAEQVIAYVSVKRFRTTLGRGGFASLGAMFLAAIRVAGQSLDCSYQVVQRAIVRKGKYMPEAGAERLPLPLGQQAHRNYLVGIGHGWLRSPPF